VNVVRHHNGNIQIVSRVMTMSAAVQHNLPGPIRHDAAFFRTECDEVRPVITLDVRQVATTEGHNFIF